jgi:hypothetical protein
VFHRNTTRVNDSRHPPLAVVEAPVPGTGVLGRAREIVGDAVGHPGAADARTWPVSGVRETASSCSVGSPSGSGVPAGWYPDRLGTRRGSATGMAPRGPIRLRHPTLPWARVSAGIFCVTKHGTEGDGVITLVLGLISAIAAYDIIDVERLTDEDDLAQATVGIGLYLVAMGGAASFVGAIAQLRASRRSTSR